jgi:hypothetical protein
MWRFDCAQATAYFCVIVSVSVDFMSNFAIETLRECFFTNSLRPVLDLCHSVTYLVSLALSKRLELELLYFPTFID